MSRTTLVIAAATALVMGALALAPQPETARPGAQPAALAPTLDQLAFLAGAWAGEMDGDHVEEHWTAPRGDNITGMFRWINADGSVALLELLAIAREGEKVTMRLRHFDARLTPWASEKTPTTVTLAECSGRKAVFKGDAVTDGNGLAGVTYECPTPDELRISVTFGEGRDPLDFALRRLK